METLFLTSDLCKTIFFLKDSKGALLGRFSDAASAKTWCDENGYRLKING